VGCCPNLLFSSVEVVSLYALAADLAKGTAEKS
jgi:hypothetical protein